MSETEAHPLCRNGCKAAGLEQRNRELERQVRELQREIGLLRQRERLNVGAIVKEVIAEAANGR